MSLSFAVIQIHHHLGSACLLITALAAALPRHWALLCMGSGTHGGMYGHAQRVYTPVWACVPCVHTCMGMYSVCTHTYRHALFLGQPWLRRPFAHPLPVCGFLQG